MNHLRFPLQDDWFKSNGRYAHQINQSRCSHVAAVAIPTTAASLRQRRALQAAWVPVNKVLDYKPERKWASCTLRKEVPKLVFKCTSEMVKSTAEAQTSKSTSVVVSSLPAG